jgi:hypothetical protein
VHAQLRQDRRHVVVGRLGADVEPAWTLSGKGTYPATATPEISRPQPLTATGGFTYTCR